MSDNERDSSAKSSRRRRWEVKSRESFDSSLAIKSESPNKLVESFSGRNHSKESIHTRKKSIDSCVKTNSLSDKISSVLDNANLPDKDNIKEKLDFDIHCQSPCPPYEGPSPTAPPFIANLGNLRNNYHSNNSITLPTEPPQYETNRMTSKITEQLHKLNEDIIDEKIANKPSMAGLSVSGLLIEPSSSTKLNGTVNTIYCEKLNNFVIANEDQIIPQEKGPVLNPIRKSSPASHAVSLQTGFRTFSIWCQGLFAGISAAHCILVFMLEGNNDVFFNIPSLEHTFYATICFLSAICLVSAFDRCDLAGQGILTGHGLRIPWTPLFYITTFILSLIMIRAEDFITYFNMYDKDIQNKRNEIMVWWKYMTLSRSLLAIFAWMALVADPHTDALNSRIAELVSA